MHIVFDYNRTLYDPETQALYPGVPRLLADLASVHTLFLVSRNNPARPQELDRLAIGHYFQAVHFVPKKDAATLRSCLNPSGRTLVVGDRVREEIALGNQLGCLTVWVRQGVFASEEPRTSAETPTHTLADLRALAPLLRTWTP